MPERNYLWLALAAYAISMVLTFRRLQAGLDSAALHRCNYVTMLLGFLFHTLFLYFRGEHLQRCPLTNAFETNVFIAWSLTLFYLIVGPSYRVSFLGAFTSPLVACILAVALLGLRDLPLAANATRSPWVEFHAAIAILAYGAFALAFVCGAMYLIQERQLKTRQLTRSFLLLPSIEQLDQMNMRLITTGLVMLTVGLVGGFISYRAVGHASLPKVIYVMAVWIVYAGLLSARRMLSWHGRRVAWVSVIAFAFVLLTFWSIKLR